jgi:hypothetical protein
MWIFQISSVIFHFTMFCNFRFEIQHLLNFLKTNCFEIRFFSPKKTGPLMEMSRTASAHDQSLRCLPNCFSLKIKDTRDINEVIILILSFHAHCFYKVNNNITQRRKSFVKSKMLTDKVRSPVPDNISVQRPKNMIKPATRTGQKYFPTKIFPYIFHIKPFIFKTFAWSHSLSDFQEMFSIKCRNKYSFFFA